MKVKVNGTQRKEIKEILEDRKEGGIEHDKDDDMILQI